MKPPLNIFEWKTSEPLPSGKKYEKLVKKINSKSKHYFKEGKDILTYLSDYRIRAYNYVGVIQIKGLRIQILPKICDQDNVEHALKNMFFLLSFTKKLKVKKINTAFFRKCRNDFFEILIKLFLEELEEVSKNSMPIDYVLNEDNLNFFRGKLLFNEHLKTNVVKKIEERVYCQFDELLLDNLLNQTIKYTLKLLKKISKNSSNLEKINKFLMIYSEITDKQVFPRDEKKIKFNRNNEAYKPVIKKCFLFIRNLSVIFKEGKKEYFALLFDMNELFEKFIARLIKKKKNLIGLKNFELESQKVIGSLAENNRIRLKPDVVFYNKLNLEKIEIILDTKYKNLGNGSRISNSDVYQMLAYGIKALCDKIILLYPKEESEEDEVKIDLKLRNEEKNVDLKEIKIFVRTINLLVKDLKEEIKENGKIIQDLKNIFGEIKNIR